MAATSGTRAVGLATSPPTNLSSFEIAGGSGVTRQGPGFNAGQSAASAAGTGSCTNQTAMTFGPFSSACTVFGVQLWDSSALTAGNMLWYGQLSASRIVAIGDSLVIAAGALVATLI